MLLREAREKERDEEEESAPRENARPEEQKRSGTADRTQRWVRGSGSSSVDDGNENDTRETRDYRLTASAGASRERCRGMQVATTRGGGQNDRDEGRGGMGGGRGGSGPMCLSRFYKSIKRGISD